jgi:hypothetical protein
MIYKVYFVVGCQYDLARRTAPLLHGESIVAALSCRARCVPVTGFTNPHISCTDCVGVVCVDKLGQFVYYERPTEMELTQILARGMTLQEMVRHWIFVTEYQYEVLMGTCTHNDRVCCAVYCLTEGSV